MAQKDAQPDRIKIEINANTFDTLKNFSRLHGLKLRVLVDVMTNAILSDEALSIQVINKAVEQQTSKL